MEVGVIFDLKHEDRSGIHKVQPAPYSLLLGSTHKSSFAPQASVGPSPPGQLEIIEEVTIIGPDPLVSKTCFIPKAKRGSNKSSSQGKENSPWGAGSEDCAGVGWVGMSLFGGL